jgi:4-hydroxybenzoate polyprenyltransferase
VLSLGALVRLTRLSTASLSALAVFVAFMGRTKNFRLSLGNAAPLLFIGMCTFIANDLEDLEKDRLIHPDRPLPARKLTPEFAAILYFVSLGVALFSTRHFVAQDIAFWYYGLAVASISYVYIVDGLPSLKTVYVAAASSIPVLIIARSFPDEPRLYVFTGSVFLFTLGREICGDIQDRDGDAVSYLHRFSPTSLAVFAFSLNALGVVLLAFQVRRPAEIADVLGMTFILAVAALYWFKLHRHRRASLLMKLQLFVGLYLLI